MSSAAESVKIVLPLPPSVLSPNCQHGSFGGRMKRAAATKKCRRLSCEAIIAQAIESGPWECATVSAMFFHKNNRRRDGCNFNAMLKAYQDGAVDSGLLVDDDSRHLTTLPPTFHIDRTHPRVEMVFSRIS